MHHKACGILFPDQGSNPYPLQWRLKHQGSPSGSHFRVNKFSDSAHKFWLGKGRGILDTTKGKGLSRLGLANAPSQHCPGTTRPSCCGLPQMPSLLRLLPAPLAGSPGPTHAYALAGSHRPSTAPRAVLPASLCI